MSGADKGISKRLLEMNFMKKNTGTDNKRLSELNSAEDRIENFIETGNLSIEPAKQFTTKSKSVMQRMYKNCKSSSKSSILKSKVIEENFDYKKYIVTRKAKK